MTYRYLKILWWTIPLFDDAEHDMLSWKGVTIHRLYSRTWKGYWGGAQVDFPYFGTSKINVVFGKVTSDYPSSFETFVSTRCIRLVGWPLAYVSFSEQKQTDKSQHD